MAMITMMMNIVHHVDGCWCLPENLPGHYCGDQLGDNCDANIVYECDDNGRGGGNNGLNFKFGQNQQRQRLQKRPVRRQVDDCRQTSCIHSTDRMPASCWQKVTATITVMAN
ncbi:uncharacterized protein LOC124496811 [Dermatophagoides farinae]|uniref:uncharacterized protein LOC124496811 n=1 Tax=Dermatophagoides farinae TaxID=6954 RepID=UPI003F5ECBD0